ncbi:FkbM family methyltransferase [Crocosphaera chwakensis]|uniref:Methyltransferase FkbM n=1 Tax=Crocosphaera chwakensis CCY0110 TaxID=391612 RepID=A3IQA2_9CHRO|nr:FkbM family methyltransferase [Crocosphaera chwakensis]EAZ91442.1 Methyltransferase FkbM [Crocosphaera chwakensis CCY0110]
MKTTIKRVFRKLGYELQSLEALSPFGANFYNDIKYLTRNNQLKIIFDVGANVGQTSQELVKNFPSSYIYAFEPVPNTFKELKKNVSKFQKVKPVNIGFGEQIGQFPITSEDLSGHNTFLIDQKEKKTIDSVQNQTTILVDVNTIDNFCQENKIEEINLLKIDTEGFEMKVLKGAENKLKQQKIDYIFVECEFYSRPNRQPHGNFSELFTYLENFNYRVVSFYTDGIDEHGWIWGNVLFCRTAHKEEGQCKRFHKLSEILDK